MIDASTPCPCGSGPTFAECHGSVADDPSEKLQEVGYWFVATIDLQGQKQAFMKMEDLPDPRDPAKVTAFKDALKDSVGVIRRMRRTLDLFQSGMGTNDDEMLVGLPPEAKAVAQRARKSCVREFRLSDGIIFACPLKPATGHFPMRGVYDIIATCAAMMCVQLAMERPVRGGIDVGTGIELDGEFYGSAWVKAHVLETDIAKFPRLAVGEKFRDYLESYEQSPDRSLEGQFERALARSVLGLLKRDSDERWIVDYAGPAVRGLMPGLKDMLETGLQFARRARARFQQPYNDKLFGRYTSLVRYLEASALEPDAPEKH